MEVENTGSRAKVQAKKPPRERKKRSPVWADYEDSRNGDGKKIANCKKCRKEFVAESTDGTNHLKRHQTTCPRWEDGARAPPPIAAPPTIPAAPPIIIGAPPEASNCGNSADLEEAAGDLAIPAAASAPTPAPPPIDEARPESSNCSKPADWEEATADLARMVALHGYDPSIVEDSYFKSFVRRLNPDFQVPSRAAIEDICDGVQDDAERVLRSALRHNYNKVNLVIDRTETAQGPVLYLACHFIDDDWNRREMMVHVNMDLPEGMEPMPLYLDGYNLGDELQIMELNDIVYEEFTIRDRVFSTRIGPVGDLKEDYLLDTEQKILYDTTHYDMLQTVASCLYNSLVSEVVKLDIESNLEEIFVTRQEREQFYTRNGLHHLLWYSCYCSLLVFHEYDSFFSSTNLIELMCHVWGEIYRAIKTISDPNHPTPNIVLRELFKVRETLHSEIAKVSGHETDLYEEIDVSKDDVVDVLVEAEAILVQRLKENIFFRSLGGISIQGLEWSIPLVLDPRYKLKYIRFVFSREFSSEAEEYISKITGEIKQLFLWFSGYISETDGEDHGTEMTSAASAHQLDQAWGEHRRSSEATKTELDRYLEGPLIVGTDAFDILNWWKLNSSFYPTLARIARAVLAIPTCRKLSSELMSQITSRIRGYSKGKLKF
ncbi:hypothetical protein ACQ4PT_005768 [Festuca glaucescens]